MSSQISGENFTAYLNSYLGTIIVQSFLSGLYTFLLFRALRAAAPKLKDGRHIFLATVLMLLYLLIMINFAFTWVVVRSVLASQGEKQQVNAARIISGSPPTLGVAHGTQIAAMIIADALLIWRCYIVWLKNKWLLIPFGLLLLAEVCLYPTYFMFKHTFSTAGFSASSISFISMAITLSCTSMIIYRIMTVTREAGTMGSYRYILEVLIESGILYSTPLLVTGVMLILHGNIAVTEAGTYLMAILVPLTGIAPMLISEHAVANVKHDEERWSQPVSTLRFRQTTSGSDEMDRGLDDPC